MSLFICRYLHVFSADRLSHGTPVFVQWNQIVAIGVGRVEHHLIRASVWWCQQSNYSGIAALQSKGQNCDDARLKTYLSLALCIWRRPWIVNLGQLWRVCDLSGDAVSKIFHWLRGDVLTSVRGSERAEISPRYYYARDLNENRWQIKPPRRSN